MKLLIAFFTLLLSQVNPSYLVVDRDLKKPVSHASSFSTEQYLQRTFPVYARDVKEIEDAIDLAVKAVEKKNEVDIYDSIQAAHTTIVIAKRIMGSQNIDITFVTKLDETNMSYSFALVRQEDDTRRVQRRLLDFAMYLNP